jgi:UDP-3-O-[3-hydroxymyristoyl] N-acetylglucosamine deacetylase / 3-hydroxyacyl-[acyl-carrier-protein] dehydratase
VLGVDEIFRLLPHRYPFLLVDSVVELEQGQRVVGLKNVSAGEPFLLGHLPGRRPVMPGLLIVEALAQVAGLLLLGAVEAPETKVVYFTSLDAVRWHREVGPGDQLRLEATVTKRRQRLGKVRGVASVGDAPVCEAELGAVVVDR